MAIRCGIHSEWPFQGCLGAANAGDGERAQFGWLDGCSQDGEASSAADSGRFVTERDFR